MVLDDLLRWGEARVRGCALGLVVNIGVGKEARAQH